MRRWQTYLVHSSLGTGYIIFGRYRLLFSTGGPYHIVRLLIIPVRDILPCDHPGPTPKGTTDITGLPPPSVRVAAPKDLPDVSSEAYMRSEAAFRCPSNFVLRCCTNFGHNRHLVKGQGPRKRALTPTWTAEAPGCGGSRGGSSQC
jgi:hypothetical protein